MYATYHLISAQEVSTDILDAIKTTCKSKPITILWKKTTAILNFRQIRKPFLKKLMRLWKRIHFLGSGIKMSVR